ncbi:LysR family transcriptional regulator [Nocardia huaxiensis]|uniref:LysR family transcriptional regulator n=1 Tax=Nocardia huaxiensis TaxID=2755382 RepID=A0A7D6Z3E3_9NOCA|nr:LysR substrate-binding domain-containing protein [Nocardia huaxiensis]QLY30024.1 LysR family transcriptional regulator [Nocardia huaxiensis]
MEHRDIEIFLTLAEELHFGRTADRLHITQSRVSHAIRKQERLIGAALFERTSRTVILTPIGEKLRADLERGYGQIKSAITDARAAANGRPTTLNVGIMGAMGHVIAPVFETFESAHPDVEIALREAHFSDPFGPLRTGEVDIQLLWLPVEETDLSVGPVVYTEPWRLAVSDRNPLAARAAVSMEDLAGQTFFDIGDVPPQYWVADKVPTHTPSGQPLRRGPRVRTFQEMLAAIAADRAVAFCCEHTVEYYGRPGVTYVPLSDAAPCQWVFVWRTGFDTALVRELSGIVMETA